MTITRARHGGRTFTLKATRCTLAAAERSRTAFRRYWWYVHIIQSSSGWYRVYVACSKSPSDGPYPPSKFACHCGDTNCTEHA